MKKTIIISASAVIAILIVILLIVFLTSSYTVTFDLQGGTLEDTTMEISVGDLYQMPIPTKKGFAFDNWYYYGEAFPPTGEWTIEEDITLVARWEYRDENGIVYEKVDGGFAVVNYKGIATDKIYVPKTYQDIPVVAIKGDAFKSLSHYLSGSNTVIVYVPDTVVSIEDGADFHENLEISRYTEMDENGIVYEKVDGGFAVVNYNGIATDKIYVPKTHQDIPVVAIKGDAFKSLSHYLSGSNTVIVYAPYTVVSIEDGADFHENLEISIYTGTDEIGLVYYEKENEVSIVSYLGNYKKDIVIPEEYNGKPITEISSKVFYGAQNRIDQSSTSFFRVLVPLSIKKIGDFTFGTCGGVKVSLYRYVSGSLREIIDASTQLDWLEAVEIGEGNGSLSDVITQVRPAFGWSAYTNASYYARLKSNGGYIDGKEVEDVALKYSKEYSLPVPVRPGYTFDGWYYGDTKVEASGAEWAYKKHITLIAKWTETK